MKPSVRRRLAPEDRQRELLVAALRVFERVPYAEVDIALLAKEAGISAGLLYHYYPGKRALFEAAFEQLARSIVTDCFMGAQGEGYRFVESCLAAYLDYATRHPRAVRMILLPSPVSAGEPGFNERLNQELAQLLAGVLGVDEKDVERTIALRGWLAFVDRAMLALVSGERLDGKRFMKRALRVLESALR